MAYFLDIGESLLIHFINIFIVFKNLKHNVNAGCVSGVCNVTRWGGLQSWC